MILKRNPNGWSCLAASFASVLGCEISEITSFLGHDGSEIIRPTLQSPYCYRGFHIQEMIDFALDRGFSVTPIEALPTLDPGFIEIKMREPNDTRLLRALANNVGVLTGKNKAKRPHAVVWDGEQIQDPATMRVAALESFYIQTFWILRAEHYQK